MLKIVTITISTWLSELVFKMIMALPFWLIWTFFGLGEKYFYFLPPIYHKPGFWNCIGIFIAVPIIYQIFVPKLISTSQNNEGVSKKD